MPPIRGFVLTTVKENPLVEVSLLSPYPSTSENGTILATWTYGLGKTAVFCTDAGRRWADWADWADYDKFFSQFIRWSMRPTGNTGDFSVATKLEEGQMQIVVDALNKDDEFLNFLDMSAVIVGPDMKTESVALRQTAPGRYVTSAPTTKEGSYFVSIWPGRGEAPLRVGVSVPYSSEFRDRRTNRELLKNLASREPSGGTAGIFRGGDEQASIEQMFEENSFRRDLRVAISSDFVWPWILLFGSTMFFGDVLVRRVAIEREWIEQTWRRATAWFRSNDTNTAPEQELARLRSRKAEISEELEDRRAAVRFEVDPEQEVGRRCPPFFVRASHRPSTATDRRSRGTDGRGGWIHFSIAAGKERRGQTAKGRFLSSRPACCSQQFFKQPRPYI